MKLSKIFPLLYLAFLAPSIVFAAKVPLKYDNAVYEDAIYSVLLQQNGSEERLPMVSLGQSNSLLLRFDELRSENDYYQYRFIHCSQNWEPSDLQALDYIEGNFYENLETFSFSQNTYFQYTHYQILFPPRTMKPKLSGNYLLVVYRNFDESDIILSRKFVVIDEKVVVEGSISQSSQVEFRFTKQEVDFVVKYENVEIPNPLLDVHAVILQNVNWNTAIYNLKPRFLNRGVMDFNYDKENNFWGVNEFRFFDLRSLRNASPGVRSKYFDEMKRPVAELFLQRSRKGQTYLFDRDFNGKMVLENNDGSGRDPNISSDYVKVEFHYKSHYGELEKPIYVFGELTDWKIKEEFQLQYDKSSDKYYCEALLKQGYYSYWYVTPEEDKPMFPNLADTEGSHFQTENDYHVLIYHKNQFLKYDELIGVARFSSAGAQKR